MGETENVIYVGGPVDRDEPGRPWGIEDEAEWLIDGWVVFMPDDCKDDELRRIEGLDRP